MQRADFVYLLNPNNNAYGSYKKKNGQSLEEFADAVLAIGKYEHIAVVDLYHQPSLSMEHLMNFKRLKNPITGKYQNFSYPLSTDIPFIPKTDDYPYPPEAINIVFDGLHPSDKGNAIIANRLVRTFKALGISAR